MAGAESFGPSDPAWFYACAIIRDPESGRLLLEHRTDDAPRNPGIWSLFGGGAEIGEDPEACLLRELQEELGIALIASDLRIWRSYVNPRSSRLRHVFQVSSIDETAPIVVAESAGFGWFEPDIASTLDLSVSTRRDLETYLRGTSG